MVRKYTAEELITATRAIAQIPDSGSVGATDADLLEHLNDALIEDLAPRVIAVQEEYFVKRERTAISSTQSLYRIPHRAMLQKLRHVRLTEDGDNPDYVRLVHVSKDEEDTRSSSGAGTDEYQVEANDIRLLNTDSTYPFLEFAYFFRPGELVLSTAAREITAVDTGTGALTLASAIPATFTTSVLYDVHSGSSGSEVKNWSMAASVASGTGVTLTATDIDGSGFGKKAVEVGDWLCLEEEAALPALPREFHPVLARAAAMRFCESVGENEEAAVHETQYQKKLQRLLRVAERRIESKPMKVTGRRGMLYAGLRGYY